MRQAARTGNSPTKLVTLRQKDADKPNMITLQSVVSALLPDCPVYCYSYSASVVLFFDE